MPQQSTPSPLEKSNITLWFDLGGKIAGRGLLPFGPVFSVRFALRVPVPPLHRRRGRMVECRPCGGRVASPAQSGPTGLRPSPAGALLQPDHDPPPRPRPGAGAVQAVAGSGRGQGRGVRAVLAETGGAGGGVRGGERSARRSDSGGVEAVFVALKKLHGLSASRDT